MDRSSLPPPLVVPCCFPAIVPASSIGLRIGISFGLLGDSVRNEGAPIDLREPCDRDRAVWRRKRRAIATTHRRPPCCSNGCRCPRRPPPRTRGWQTDCGAG